MLDSAIRDRIQTALHLLYPPRCLGCGEMVDSDFGLCGPCWRDTPFIGGVVCDACGVPLPGLNDGHRIECDDCMRRPRPWEQGRAALLYQSGARKMVLALKHGDRQDIARPAARWMASAARSIVQPDMVVVPVPLHWSRLLKRRYNQAALLSSAVAGVLQLDPCPDALQRRKRTGMLDHKTHDQRFDELSEAIVPHPRRQQRLNGRPVLLIDDVMTSGATLSACAVASRKAGASDVFVLALARVAKGD